MLFRSLIADEKQQNPINTSLGTPSTETVGWASAHQTNPADATPSSIGPEKPLPHGGGVWVGVTNTPATTTNTSTTSLDGVNPVTTSLDAANPANTPLDATNPANTPLDAANPANIPLDTTTAFIHAADPIPHPQDIAATSLKHPHPNLPPPAGEGADRTPLGTPSIETVGGATFVENIAHAENRVTTPLDAANPVNTPLNATAPAADTETIPSPACGGRWPEAGRGETANPANTSLDGASPVNTSLGAPKTATLR